MFSKSDLVFATLLPGFKKKTSISDILIHIEKRTKTSLYSYL